MEYQENAVYAANALAAGQVVDRPYLARISDLADEAAKTGDLIELFIDRCRGGGRNESTKQATAPHPTGHLAQLDRLNQNLARVTQLACELSSIG